MTLEKHTTYIQIVFNKFSTVFILQDWLNLGYRIHILKAITLGLEHLWILVSTVGPETNPPWIGGLCPYDRILFSNKK